MARSASPSPDKSSKSTVASKGEKVIAFIERFLLVPEGSHIGQPVVLRDWQKELIRSIYDTPTRRAIISFGRKNGKTSLSAMLLLAHLVGPVARPNAQIFSAAQSREQASIVFGLAAKMIRMSDELSGHVKVKDTAKELFCILTGVRYRALSAEATTAYGLSPAFVIHDELGQVRGPRSELYDALETACAAYEDPLSIIISTQAPSDADLLSTLIDDARAAHDPKIKLFLYAADPEDDPWNEVTWQKANPALGDFLHIEEIRGTADTAQRLPAAEAAFLNLHLNRRIAALNHFLTPSVWALNADEPDMGVFYDSEVYGGLDLSSRQDLTAFVLIAKDRNDVWHVCPYFWAPMEGLRERAMRDRVPYDMWRKQRKLIATPGKSIDFGYVARKIGEACQAFNVKKIAFDRWRINDLQRELQAIGVEAPLEPHGQGYRDMSPALEILEDAAINGRLRHGAHPILTWCAANAVVTVDPVLNRKLDKAKATGRIDGIIALAMAMRIASADLNDQLPPSPWEDNSFRMVTI